MAAKTKLKWLTISDVHLGHRKNPTSRIVKNLRKYFGEFRNDSQFTDLDILFIAGDLFDRLLDAASDDIPEILLFLGALIRFCARHQIKLRILEGTPSHDWKQSKLSKTIFELVAGLDPTMCDFRYIDTLFIEHIKDLDIHVLYVPDEWTPDSDLTYRQVQGLLKDAGLEKVQISIMHGMFQYQVPSAAPDSIPRHKEADYLDITEWYINIGHDHHHTVSGRIIAEGSFDRLAHGEEEPKGGILCEVDNGELRHTFIENPDALVYKTIEMKYKDLDRSVEQIRKVLAKIPEDSMVRIKATKTHPVYIAFDEIKIMFPMFTFTKISLEDEEEQQSIQASAIDLDRDYTAFTINRDNIVELITNEVKWKHNLGDGASRLLQSSLEQLNG